MLELKNLLNSLYTSEDYIEKKYNDVWLKSRSIDSQNKVENIQGSINQLIQDLNSFGIR